MKGFTAKTLTDIFNQRAPGRWLDFSTTQIYFEAVGGANVSVRPLAPEQAAEYLISIRDGHNPLFYPGRLSQKISEPICLSFEGTLTRQIGQYRKEYRFLKAVTFRFFTMSGGSQLIFHEEFGHYGGNEARAHSGGPSLNEMIRILQRAGNDWRKVNFMPDGARPFLRILKK